MSFLEMHLTHRSAALALALALTGPLAGVICAQTTASTAARWMTGYFSANNTILSPDNVAWGKYTHVIDFAASTDGNGNLIPYYIKSATETALLITDAHKNGKKGKRPFLAVWRG